MPDAANKKGAVIRNPREVSRLLGKSGVPASFIAKVRQQFGLGRKQFSRLTSFSERAVSGWERGAQVTEPGLRKMRELERLVRALGEVMQADYIPQWLHTPAEEFGGSTPLEVIERGEVDRIWRFIYYLESGMPV
jgi:DNA-binding transcriptional regulator YiaG